MPRRPTWAAANPFAAFRAPRTTPFFGCTGVRPQWIRSNQRCPTYTKLGDDTSKRKKLLFLLIFLMLVFYVCFSKQEACNRFYGASFIPIRFFNLPTTSTSAFSESTRKAKVYITAWNRSFGQIGRWPTTNFASARVLAVWVSAVVVHGSRQWGDLCRRRCRQRRVPWTTYEEMQVLEWKIRVVRWHIVV